jgi:alpha-1,3-rhamnosyl/mannosyltransferase
MTLGLDARKLTDFGIGTYIEHLVEGLAEHPDISPVLFVRPDHAERAQSLAPQARVVELSSHGYTVGEQIQLPLAAWREHVQLLHAPHYVVPLVAPCPVVTTVHDIIPLLYPPRQNTALALAYLRAMMRSALRRSRAVIAVSRTTRHDLIASFAADPRRVTVIPNGVDPAHGIRPPAEVLDDLKARLGLRPPVLLVIANDKPHKNVDLVLRAFHRAVRNHRLAGQLVLAGGFEPGDPIEARAHTLGLGDRVRCVGRISGADLRGLYHVSSLLIHLALYEGFGLPILEAMAAGLPVIASNLGALREIGEGPAQLVHPQDVGEIATALARVLVDDPLRRRMIDAGRRKAERFTWHRTVDGTVAVYRKALGAA